MLDRCDTATDQEFALKMDELYDMPPSPKKKKRTPARKRAAKAKA
jgi:hypothetical protein